MKQIKKIIKVTEVTGVVISSLSNGTDTAPNSDHFHLLI